MHYFDDKAEPLGGLTGEGSVTISHQMAQGAWPLLRHNSDLVIFPTPVVPSFSDTREPELCAGYKLNLKQVNASALAMCIVFHSFICEHTCICIYTVCCLGWKKKKGMGITTYSIEIQNSRAATTTAFYDHILTSLKRKAAFSVYGHWRLSQYKDAVLLLKGFPS